MSAVARQRRVIEKYLGTFAERQDVPDWTRFLGDRVFEHGLTIPAYSERLEDFRTLESIPGSGCDDALVVLVINEPRDAPRDAAADNQALLAGLVKRYSMSSVADGLWSGEADFGALCIIERTRRTTPLPAGQGVGLARKIGADLALHLHAAGRIRSSWIHFTDADASLPTSYFGRVDDQADAVAAVYPFVHETSDPSLRLAIDGYECALRHYVLGLSAAGSPYAYHSIGSTMAVRFATYAAVRGVPRRNAAEDFYLLNKILKTGDIQRLGGSPLVLRARLSHRVPFGTGPALQKRLEAGGTQQVYAPVCFEYLGVLLGAMPALLLAANGEDQRVLDDACRALGLDGSMLWQAVITLGIQDLIASARGRAASAPARLRHALTAFDAFMTRKFIHQLRDSRFGDVPLEQALRWHKMAGGPAAAGLAKLEETHCRGPVGI